MHGLFNKDLEKIIIKNEYNYLDIPEYRERFGFCNIQKIIDIEITTKYLLKYICKDLDKNVTRLNKHVYFCSRNLKRAKKIYETFNIYNIDYDFKNKYCKQKAYTKLSDLEADLQIKL